LLGSNGAGKSTLNNTVSGLVPADRRHASHFDGADLTGARVAATSSRAGLIQVPEGRRIFPNLSVRENLELGRLRARARAPRAQPRARVRHLPAPEGAHRAEGRHDERRRAADAGHRARA
jgi:branched-chain amino acid transport system ATP-binding protein